MNGLEQDKLVVKTARSLLRQSQRVKKGWSHRRWGFRGWAELSSNARQRWKKKARLMLGLEGE